MNRTGQLWERLVSWPNLRDAVHRAALGKRGRPDVAAFLLDWECQAVDLLRELRDGTYRPGSYRTFLVREPKQRRISAAPFRDRVVHHALTQVLGPAIEPRFAAQSYACRVGLGTHKALEAAARAARLNAHVLKCDIRKYFPSIDHAILLRQLEGFVKCRRTLDLAATIVAGSNTQEPADWYFPGDTLFTPFERRRGLPLGNQTSQFFANVYLNDLDHFILRELKPHTYCRYVDDFLLFHPDKAFLAEARRRIQERLDGVRLLLHPGKSRTYRCEDGVTFLGWRLFPDHRRLVAGNVKRFRRRVRKMQREYAAGRLAWEDVEPCLQAWNAHAAHGDTWRLREEIFEESPFRVEKKGEG
jgi:retron-type reverse transcriptase